MEAELIGTKVTHVDKLNSHKENKGIPSGSKESNHMEHEL